MSENHHRQDISDRIWATLELLLPGRVIPDAARIGNGILTAMAQDGGYGMDPL